MNENLIINKTFYFDKTQKKRFERRYMPFIIVQWVRLTIIRQECTFGADAFDLN